MNIVSINEDSGDVAKRGAVAKSGIITKRGVVAKHGIVASVASLPRKELSPSLALLTPLQSTG